MTTSQPTGDDIPPNTPLDGYTVENDALPRIPPRPGVVTMGVAGLAAVVLALLAGSLIQFVMLDHSDPAIEYTRSNVLGDLIILPGAAIVLITVLAVSIWRGSSTASTFAIVLMAGGAILSASKLGDVMVRVLGGASLPVSLTQVLDSPLRVLIVIGGAFGIPVLLILVRPAGRRWSQQATTIRYVRRRMRRGLPVYRLPPDMMS
ncbi:MAG: hypothetical protein ACRD0P_29475 [Stackebrandtia sp.]